MSTYYDFVCDIHKQKSGCVCICRNFPDRRSGLDDDDLPQIRAFLTAHMDCKPRLVSEHSDEYEAYETFKPQEPAHD